MHRFNGRHYPGYMQTVRAIKRREAEERNAATPKQRTKAYRRTRTR